MMTREELKQLESISKEVFYVDIIRHRVLPCKILKINEDDMLSIVTLSAGEYIFKVSGRVGIFDRLFSTYEEIPKVYLEKVKC